MTRNRRIKMEPWQKRFNQPNLPWVFIIEGAPRTKNTGRVIGAPGKRGIVIPPKPYREWHRAAMAQVQAIRQRCGLRGICTDPVDVTAVFYRDRNVGDEDRYCVGLGDFLEDACFVWDDDLIHWTGDTRREIDRDFPRTEVTIAARK